MPRTGKSLETESRLVVAQSVELEQNGAYLWEWNMAFFSSDENVLGLGSGDGCTICEYSKNIV